MVLIKQRSNYLYDGKKVKDILRWAIKRHKVIHIMMQVKILLPN